MQQSNRLVASQQMLSCISVNGLLKRAYCLLSFIHILGLLESVGGGRLYLVDETVARRRSASLLSEFGLGHVREYVPFGPVGPWCPACTLPSSSGLASHPSCKVLAHLIQMCENGTSCNILVDMRPMVCLPKMRFIIASYQINNVDLPLQNTLYLNLK